MQIDVLTLIGNYAFPIVMCIALFWKMDKDQKENREENSKRDEIHREEMNSIRESLDNNTAALVQLTLQMQTKQ